MPFFFEAATLSRILSPVSSRSNWAKDKSTFRVSRPIDVVVLNCCVTATKEIDLASKASTSLAKSASERVRRVPLGIQRIELQVQAMLGGLAGVDGATQRLWFTCHRWRPCSLPIGAQRTA